jgi:hypothetical protein
MGVLERKRRQRGADETDCALRTDDGIEEVAHE